MKSYFYSLKGEKIFFAECKTSKPTKDLKLILKEIPEFEEYTGIFANHGINFDCNQNPFVVLMGRDDIYAKNLLYKYFQDKIDEKNLELEELHTKRNSVSIFEMEGF